MLGGSVLGGYIAQVTNIGVPYLLRAAALALSFMTAFLLMHDIGFTPKRDGGAVRQAKAVVRGAIQYGFANRPVRWVMIASAFTDGVSIYGFYAMQPYCSTCTAIPRRMASPGSRRRLSVARRLPAVCSYRGCRASCRGVRPCCRRQWSRAV